MDSVNAILQPLLITLIQVLVPILLGAAGSAHVLTPSATVRRVVNMTALAAAHSSLKAG